MESYYMWVGALLVLALTLKYAPNYIIASPTQSTKSESQTLIEDNKTKKQKNEIDSVKLKEFAQFQRWYIVIFLFVMLADWMQGPYVYKLYASYNIPTQQIAVLFIIGFGTSGFLEHLLGVWPINLAESLCAFYFAFFTLCAASPNTLILLMFWCLAVFWAAYRLRSCSAALSRGWLHIII